MWPRVEVETVWKILLFFGSPKSLDDPTSHARWQLISKLFSSSVFAKSKEESSSLPPNPLQLCAFESDIDTFVHLLSKGALDALPETDTLVKNLVRMGLNLQAEDYLWNEESRFHSFPEIRADKNMTHFIARLWKSTQSLFTFDSLTAEDDRQTVYELDFRAAKSGGEALKVKNLLLPNSRLLGGCLSLLVAWARRVPQKKVRQFRFLKQLKSLRESLTALDKELTLQRFNNPAGDAFADAFTERRPVEIGDSQERTSLFLCESSAYLRIFESILRETDSARLNMVPQMKSLSLPALKEVSVATSENFESTTFTN